MLRIVYFIRNLLVGTAIAAIMALAIYIAITYIWGIPIMLGLLVIACFVCYAWEAACNEYEEKRGNKKYSHLDMSQEELHKAQEEVEENLKKLQDTIKELKE